MKGFVKTKIVLSMLIFVLLFSLTVVMANAREAINMTYNGNTQQEAVNKLQEAMEKAEQGYDVTLTLESNMAFYPETANTAQRIDIGSVEQSGGTLYITSKLDVSGTPLYGIMLDNYVTLYFQGNVRFDNIKLDRDTKTTASYYSGSYIMVSGGKAVFGNRETKSGNISVANVSGNIGRIAVSGDDLEIYTGYYSTVCANWRLSGIEVDSPKIYIGGNTVVSNLVGRTIYAGSVTGDSELTVDGSAVIGHLVGGYYSCRVDESLNHTASFAGNATVNVKNTGGRIENISFVGYQTVSPTHLNKNSNADEAPIRSKYVLNIFDGTKISGPLSVYSATTSSLKYVDVELNLGNATYLGKIIGGALEREGSNALEGVQFTDSSVAINLKGATISRGFIGGSYFPIENGKTKHNKNVDDVERIINFEKVVFESYLDKNNTVWEKVCFGSYFDTDSTYAEHRGNTKIVVNTSAEKRTVFGKGLFTAGSVMLGKASKHTGDITVEMTATSGMVDKQYDLELSSATRYMGCYIDADECEFSANVDVSINAMGDNMYVGNNKPIIALNYVGEDLSGVSLSGSSVIALTKVHCGGDVYGGSVIYSPVKNTSDTKLVLVNCSTYGDSNGVKMQLFGGNLIYCSGVESEGASSILEISNGVLLANSTARLFGGSKINAQNAEERSDSLVIIKNGTLNKNVYGGSYLNADGSRHSGSSAVEINGCALTGSEVFGGSLLAMSGTMHNGNSRIEINGGELTGMTFYGGSDLKADGAIHSGKSEVTKGTQAFSMLVYGGSKISANGTHSGASRFYIKGTASGDWTYSFASPKVFGGSYIGNENGIHSGMSEIEVDSGATGGIFSKGNVSLYGGSELVIAGALHTGDSKIVVGDVDGEATVYLTAHTYGGSLISAYADGKTTAHKAKSSVILNRAAIQSSVNVMGGSYLNAQSAQHIGNSTVELYGKSNLSSGNLFGGSYILANGAVHKGDSKLRIEIDPTSEIKSIHGGGSYTNRTDLTGDSREGYLGVFGHVGNVYYEFISGTMGGSTHPAGYLINVDGDVYSTISGGTFTSTFYSISAHTANFVSISGNSALRITGGTFNSNIVNGNSANNTSNVGANVVGKAYYMELIDDGVDESIVFAPSGTTIPLEPAGRGHKSDVENKNSYLKIVGDVPFYDKDGKQLVSWNFTSRIGFANSYIDLTRYTSATPFISTSSFKKVYNPIGNEEVSINVEENLDLFGCANLSGRILNWSDYSYSYDELSAYDELSVSPNAPRFADVRTLGGFTESTRKVVFVYGDMTFATYELSDGALEVLAKLDGAYNVAGCSIRVGNLAMRCRAKISRQFFENNGKSARDLGGYKLSKLGILVSKNDGELLTFDSDCVLNAIAWENGVLKTNGGDWSANYDDIDSFYFAAVVTGYDTNGKINVEKINAPIYFRAYAEIIDSDGRTVTIYLDNPRENSSGNTYKNYGRSLVEITKLVWEFNQEFVKTSVENYNTVVSVLREVANKYNFDVKSNNLGSFSAEPLVPEQNGTRYILSVETKLGYVVESFKFNGVEKELVDNKLEIVVSNDSSVEIKYARKVSDELTERRETAIENMDEMTGTFFRYDQDYLYYRNGLQQLDSSVLYRGMLYSEKFANSFDGWMMYAGEPDENGVYTLSFPNPDSSKGIYFGSSCTNTVFWAWAEFSPTISFTYSANMIESKGCITVGTFVCDEDDFKENGYWADTKLLCDKNGEAVMYESYAYMVGGDTIAYLASGGNHTIFIKDVVVVYDADGSIDPEKSYIIYADQHGGRSKKTENGVTYYTTCNFSAKKTFKSMYDTGYIPLTCVELLGDSSDGITVPDSAYVYDSITGAQYNEENAEIFDETNVTDGYFYSNFAFSTMVMTLTDKTTGETTEITRHMRENYPHNMQANWFVTNNGDYDIADTYDDKLDINSLEKGEYEIVFKAYLANGGSVVARRAVFTIE